MHLRKSRWAADEKLIINELQGVVTPIGAILKAATGDTICVRLNLAVTP